MRKLIALVVIALITSFILFGHRLIVNRTHSLPVGLYYWSDVPIKKGSIVLFKPDQNIGPERLGFDRGYEARELPLLKRVVAFVRRRGLDFFFWRHHQWRTSAQQCTAF